MLHVPGSVEAERKNQSTMELRGICCAPAAGARAAVSRIRVTLIGPASVSVQERGGRERAKSRIASDDLLS